MSLQYDRLMNLALRFLSLRLRSEYELTAYFDAKCKTPEDEEVRDRVWQRLRELGYVDDYKFASWLVASRTRTKPRGIISIRQELRRKKVPQDVITAVLSVEMGEESEYDRAIRAVGRRKDGFGQMDPLSCRRKLSSFLSRRGFSYDTVDRLVDEYCAKTYNTGAEN